METNAITKSDGTVRLVTFFAVENCHLAGASAGAVQRRADRGEQTPEGKRDRRHGTKSVGGHGGSALKKKTANVE